MRLRPWGMLVMTMALAACGERRDIADVAAGLAPFDQLRGVNIAELRAGQIRAMRRQLVPAPFEGYRERLGDWDLVFGVQGFDGSDGSYPREDVQILEVEATREFAADSAARQSWMETATRVRAETGATPHCVQVSGAGFAVNVVEFERGGDWRLAVSYAPSVRLTNRKTLSPRVGVAVRRSSLTQRFPERGQPNPDSLPVWTATPEECQFP